MPTIASPGQITLPVILGPTASGKTDVALRIARRIRCEIVSADSRQIYRHMSIGTAAPTEAERRFVRHHFVDEREPRDECSAGEFSREGRERIAGIVGRGAVPLVVGGSGLYIRALVDGLFDGPPADDSIRAGLEKRAESEGPESLLEELRLIDPEAAGRMRPSNLRRIIRALEVYRLTGRPISLAQKEPLASPFRPVMCGLRWERSALYRRIDLRVGRMIEGGLIEEAVALRRLGYSPALPALQTVGYAEAFRMIDGEISAAEMIRLIRMNSRRYAKRQMTWFRKDPRIVWFDVAGEGDFEGVALGILGRLRE